MFKLLNREITYDVDVSKVGCGVNGALYLSEMSASGDASNINKAGAKYGTGYCDAQCPKNNFISGEANLNHTYGACCNEMDLWEANREAQALTPHPCNAVGVKKCTGTTCGNDVAVGTCDQGGCDFNPYRNGKHDFYGPGKSLDTSKPFTVVTQFQTQNGTEAGDLITINRFYKQNGKFFLTPSVNITGFPSYFNWIGDDYCAAENTAFGGGANFPFKARGGMKQMGKALGRGMVLIFSIWQDSGSFMQWLDGQTGDPSVPGNLRGPCSPTGGHPDEILKNNVDAAVTWSNIKFGEFGTTY
jgi:cellulose 1,4-beta-cellobiosidase